MLTSDRGGDYRCIARMGDCRVAVRGREAAPTAAGDLDGAARDAGGAARGDGDAAGAPPRAVGRQRREDGRPSADADPGGGGRARRRRASARVRRGGLGPPLRAATCSRASAARAATTGCTSSSQIRCAHPDCPLGAAVVAPLVVQGERVGIVRGAVRARAGGCRRTRPGPSARRRASSRRSSSWPSSRPRASGSRAPSCVRCARRSRRTSSTTRSRRSPATSTRAPRRRASC